VGVCGWLGDGCCGGSCCVASLGSLDCAGLVVGDDVVGRLGGMAILREDLQSNLGLNLGSKCKYVSEAIV
jgi:hypothetical protein